MKTQTWYELSGKIAILLLLVIFGLTLAVGQLPVWAQEREQTAVILITLPTELITKAEGGTRVWLEAPETAVVGQPFVARLMAESVTPLGGFEVIVQHDTAQVVLLKASASEGWAGQREQLHIGSLRLPDGVILSSASCPVADCTSIAYAEAPRLLGSPAGPVELATFEFEARSSGELKLDLADILLVDSAGQFLLASSHYEAETVDRLATTAPALDLSGNNVVNDADAYQVVSLWRELVRDGSKTLPVRRCLQPGLLPYDVNGSGCLNVADIQTILASWGTVTAVPPVTETLLATLTVNSVGDNNDMIPGDGVCLTAVGNCTLRAAIAETNALPGADTITFDIRNTDGSCPNLVTINPATALTIDAADNAGVTIDGYTQCNTSANSQWITGNAVIKIEIRGLNTAFVYGLHLLSPNNVIRGLAVYNWHRQIQLLGSRAHHNTIEGNFIGTNAANTFTQSAPSIEGDGLRLEIGAHDNLIGGNTTDKRNIVSGNDQDGIGLQGDGVNGNLIFNNYVGLAQNGSARLRNGADGVDVAEGAANNQIGGLNPGERNVISGNNRDGVEISHDIGTTGNHIVGNFIGLNPAGNANLYNGGRGVALEDNVIANQLYRNVIVANAGDGVRFYTVFNNDLYDNFIGVVPTGLGPLDVVPLPGTENGLVAMPNGSVPSSRRGLSGVFMTAGSQGNNVMHNIIAYHPEYGINLNANKGYLAYGTCETYYNTFSQNRIYDNVSKGIRLKSGICDGLTFYPNQGLAVPQITAATTVQVTGNSCANCRVEVFLADKLVVNDPSGDNYGEGKTYLGQGTANGTGLFVIPISGVAVGAIITAHTVDSARNTSQFARNVAVAITPTPTNTPAPTNTPTPTNSPTPSPTPVVQLPFGGVPWAIPGRLEAENYDVGGQNVAFYDTTSANQGGLYRTDRVDIQTTGDIGGGYNIGWVVPGEWLEFTVNVASAGAYNLGLRIASLNAGGTVHVEVDGANVTGPITFGPTGGSQIWTTISASNLNLAAGTHVVRLSLDSSGFNLNWIEWTAGG